MSEKARSNLALAKALGVSEGAVRKALKAGRISRDHDGGYDIEACRSAWSSNTRPDRTRVRAAPSMVRTEADAREAVTMVRRILEEEGADAGSVDFNAARTAETIIKTREREMKLQVAGGKLVSADAVHKAVFALAREERDALSNWPSRVAPLIAAEIGADQVRLAVALEKHVREHLAERSTRDLRIAG